MFFPTKKTSNNTYGNLTFIQSKKDISFDINRVYYIYKASSGITRGCHAHKELEQVLICLYGSIEIVLDDGFQKEIIILDDPSKGLYVGPKMWRTMKWLKDDSVLLVLASDYYDESDYIRDYDVFLDFLNKKEGSEN